MHRLIVLVVLALGCATGPAVTQTEPQLLVVARPVAEVISLAGAQLVRSGFEVRTSDAGAGLLTATRERASVENVAYVTCNWAPGSASEKVSRTTITASVSASAIAESTRVAIHVRVITAYPDLAFPPPPSEKWCASNGALEKSLAAALTP